MAKSKKKPKKSKSRIKVAPPSKRHKSVKDYDKKASRQETKDALGKEKAQNIYAGSSFEDFLDSERIPDMVVLDAAERQWKTDVIESEEPKKSWADYFFAIFGFKRK